MGRTTEYIFRKVFSDQEKGPSVLGDYVTFVNVDFSAITLT